MQKICAVTDENTEKMVASLLFMKEAAVSNYSTICALLVLNLLTVTPRAQADTYDDGMEAYQIGDYKQALKRWKTLAERGHAQALYNLGFMYEFGYGVTAGDKQAFSYYLRAAQQGHLQAQHTVAWMYARGKGVTADSTQAEKWTEISTRSEKTGSSNQTNEQKFADQLASELKKAALRYDAQKAARQNPPIELEASNQTS